jgi:hypothetical protein
MHIIFFSDDVHATSITFMVTLRQWLEVDLSLSAISPGHQQLVACLCLYNNSINPKVTDMMHTESAKHVKKANHENNALLGSHAQIAVLTQSRMYHIPEYVTNVPMYLEHWPSDVTLNQAYEFVYRARVTCNNMGK